MDALGIGVSGVLAAQNRVGLNAANTANQTTSAPRPEGTNRAEQARNYEGYRPARAADSSQATGGGVVSGQSLVDPSFVLAFEPDNVNADADGIVARPNVDLAQERVDTLSARHSFNANIATIRTADEMMGTLLDIKE
jgi:flagellar basal-body rod protein FlgC